MSWWSGVLDKGDTWNAQSGGYPGLQLKTTAIKGQTYSGMDRGTAWFAELHTLDKKRIMHYVPNPC